MDSAILGAMRASSSRFLLCLAVLLFAQAAESAPLPSGAEPAFVVRGRQTEARQRALNERLERIAKELSDRFRREAPDLLAALEPPPPTIFGYRILPRVVPDAPLSAPAEPQVMRYSWPWSDTLIEREMAKLDQLEADLAGIPLSATARRAAYEALAADYRKAVERSRPIASDVDYNWHWQRQIVDDRLLFDRLTAQLDAAVAQRKAEAGTASSVRGQTGPVFGFDPPGFLRIEKVADRQWVFKVPVVTDIVDEQFVRAFRAAIENHWHVRAGQAEYRVQLAIEVRTPEQLYCEPADPIPARVEGCTPPGRGEHVDLDKHVARFPKHKAVLTTGAATIQLVAGRALVLSPHDVAQRTLAHEFGHILGFPDVYLRGYRDLGADGFQVLELVIDTEDIMASPGAGSVQARHFEGLMIATDAGSNMGAGLNALYARDDPEEAIARFRKVLALNPDHYGATLQLAKALDRAGKPDTALVWWKKILAMAEAAHDAETMSTARARIFVGR